VLAACAAFLISCGGVAGSPQQPTRGSGQLTLNPTSLDFGDVTVSNSSTQTVTLTNSGTASVTISQADLTGTGFSLSALPLPLTLATGQATTFDLTFAPASSGSATGSLSLLSDAANSPTTLTLAGNGVLPLSGQLTLNPTSLDFGDVTVGNSSTQTVTLTNSGTTSVTISQADLTGTDFSVSSILLTLTAGQTTTFTVTFAPTTSGSHAGTLTLISDAANSPSTLPLAGNGVAPIAHEVDLFWDPSSSPNVAGYNVYRAIQSGGPYIKLNPVLIVPTTHTDATVVSGNTYFYVATAQDGNGAESTFSNEAVAVVPLP
jgi:archaellum component FlaF (FlaF/FlaG flagellin family)